MLKLYLKIQGKYIKNILEIQGNSFETPKIKTTIMIIRLPAD